MTSHNQMFIDAIRSQEPEEVDQEFEDFASALNFYMTFPVSPTQTVASPKVSVLKEEGCHQRTVWTVCVRKWSPQ